MVGKDGAALAAAGAVAPTLQAALDDWERCEQPLRALAADLDAGRIPGLPLDPARLHAPLPRAYEWVDGSAFLHHVRLVRRARGADLPPSLERDPLVYQGGSGVLSGPTDPIPLLDETHGLDFEGEVCAVLGDVPLGTRAAEAGRLIRLLTLANDVTLRNLVPAELAKGFGFFQSKPATAFAPFAVTPDEVGPAWRGGRLHLRLRVLHNGALVGDCDAGEMHFTFLDLVAHVARTRAFTAGTILGSGTVSSADRARGCSCLVERRAREVIDAGPGGQPHTPWLRPGDRVAMEVLDTEGRSVFGRIAQEVVSCT